MTRAAAALAVLLSAVGLARTLYLHGLVERRTGAQAAPIDERYRGLCLSLAGISEVGYLSDLPWHRLDDPGARLYLAAAYALAPVALEPATAATTTFVVNASSAEAAARIARERGLQVLGSWPPGQALLKRTR